MIDMIFNALAVLFFLGLFAWLIGKILNKVNLIGKEIYHKIKNVCVIFLAVSFVGGVITGMFVNDDKNFPTNTNQPAQKVEQTQSASPPQPARAATLHLTPLTFQQRYNQIMTTEMGEFGASGTLNIGVPQIESGQVQDVVQYVFGNSAILMEIIDKNTGEIKEIMVTAMLSQDPETFRANLMYGFLIYVASIKATNPNLNSGEMQGIQEKLGLHDSNNLLKDMSFSYAGINYSKKSIQKVGIAFTISAQ